MENSIEQLQLHFDSIDLIPQSVYLLDQNGEVFPKQIFTVIRKRVNYASLTVEVYIKELEKFVEFDPGRIETVHQCFVN